MTYIDEDTVPPCAPNENQKNSVVRVKLVVDELTTVDTVTTVTSEDATGFADMADDPRLEQAFSLIRAVIADSDRRAQDEILARISGKLPASNPSLKHETEKRAPRGSAGALVDRVLSDAGDKGTTVLGILKMADTEFEKMVSPSAVRNWLRENELKNPPRYRQYAGVWYLAGRGPALKIVQK
jgi:hypothetical protein